jgi:hypothetical protein
MRGADFARLLIRATKRRRPGTPPGHRYILRSSRLDRTLECNCLPQVSSADQFLQNGHYSKDKCSYGRKPISHDFRAAHHVSRESGRDIDVIRHAPKSGDGFRMAYSVFGSKIAPWQSPANRNHQLPEWPTFRPAHLFACFHPTRSSGCWRSPGFT